ncbi:uncharacterized protein LOC133234712 [Bos javanicus]|uniref:uncharacterized protein LOC133234712 n=1 Tax=Bos javanicus TaxID=9906 RepID=UPI002AA8AA03|nr:uncharacterized protein LOC133234712 [Bos javanicus]
MQAPGDRAHGGISPTGHEEEAGKACCTDANQDTARAQSQADTELSIPGSDPEPQKILPLRQQGDLEPSMVDHRALASNYNQTRLSSPVPTAMVATGAGSRDKLRGDRDLRLSFPKTPGQLATNQGNDVTSWQQNPTEPGTWVSRPPQWRGAPSQIACFQDVLLFAPAQRPGPGESSQSFPLDVANEGDTPCTSLREGLDHHPSAREAQCRLQVSMPMEGSAQLGMKRKHGRPAAQTPPRTHPRAQSQAATELSTPDSNPEPREALPLRQQEDLEPSMAEHRGEPVRR